MMRDIKFSFDLSDQSELEVYTDDGEFIVEIYHWGVPRCTPLLSLTEEEMRTLLQNSSLSFIITHTLRVKNVPFYLCHVISHLAYSVIDITDEEIDEMLNNIYPDAPNQVARPVFLPDEDSMPQEFQGVWKGSASASTSEASEDGSASLAPDSEPPCSCNVFVGHEKHCPWPAWNQRQKRNNNR